MAYSSAVSAPKMLDSEPLLLVGAECLIERLPRGGELLQVCCFLGQCIGASGGYYGGYANRSYVTGRPTLIPRRYAW
jgi:hypothetical protein